MILHLHNFQFTVLGKVVEPWWSATGHGNIITQALQVVKIITGYPVYINTDHEATLRALTFSSFRRRSLAASKCFVACCT